MLIVCNTFAIGWARLLKVGTKNTVGYKFSVYLCVSLSTCSVAKPNKSTSKKSENVCLEYGASSGLTLPGHYSVIRTAIKFFAVTDYL